MQPYKTQQPNFTEQHFSDALSGDLSGLRSVPKVDLHAHSTLSTPFEKVKKIAPEVDTPPTSFSDFSDFMDYISRNYFPIYSDSIKVWQLHEACLEGMIEEGVIYTEMSYELTTPLRMGITWQEHAEKIKEQIRALSDSITICCEIGIKRESPREEWEHFLPQALDTGLFSSIDLYGDYEKGDVSQFSDLFNICRNRGLKVKIHSGEFTSSDYLENDLTSLTVDGIQHGITIVNYPELMERYAQLKTPFNVCPTSSVRLSHVNSYNEHPIRKMIDAGLHVTIGTDDLSIFNSTLSEEYLSLYKTGLYSVDELNKIRTNGIEVYQSMIATNKLKTYSKYA